ncbi:MAG: RloB family protein [Cytophagales bacterium]|nr:RloB family protein [Cytophagales bacterium]
MARVKKIDNSILKRIQQKQEREKRKYRTKEKRVRLLIVCEGEKTEPNYFNSIDRLLPRGIVDLKVIGEGNNTLDVVESAIKLRNNAIKSGNDFDYVWTVFDRDSFPPNRFNDAVFLASREGIHCAYSNEAFELWYLLHFEFYNTAISRHNYITQLEKFIGKKYKKNDKEMYGLINERGNQDNAINWARKLEERYDGSNPSMENPVTKVYKLVEFLDRYLEKDN